MKKISSYKYTVIFTDGTEENIESNIGDRLAYGRTARAKNWGKIDDDYNLYLFYIVWSVLRRTRPNFQSWEDFADPLKSLVADVRPLEIEEAESPLEAVGKDI